MHHPGPAGKEAIETVRPPDTQPTHHKAISSPPSQGVEWWGSRKGTDLFLLGIGLKTFIQGTAGLLVCLLLPPHTVCILDPFLLEAPEQAGWNEGAQHLELSLPEESDCLYVGNPGRASDRQSYPACGFLKPPAPMTLHLLLGNHLSP